MYWGWAFTWDGAAAKLEKGKAVLNLAIERPSAARRHVDCLLITNDLAYLPSGRNKADCAAMRYLREWTSTNKTLSSLIPETGDAATPEAWHRPKVGGSDFLMPWNTAREFWTAYEKPQTERPLYPFNAEPIEEFINKYKGSRDVPLSTS